MWLANIVFASNSDDIHDSTNAWTAYKVKPSINKQVVTQSFLIKEKFDKEKDTIILLPFMGGSSSYLRTCDNLAQAYNIVLLTYSYYLSGHKKTSNYKTFDDIVNSIEQMMPSIRSKLKEKYDLKDDNDLDLTNKLILCGQSMGAMISTKIAAKSKEKSFKYVLNVSFPYNFGIASKNTPITEIVFSVAYLLLFSIFFGTTYGTIKHNNLLKLSNNYIVSSIIAIVSPIICIIIFSIFYFPQASKVGVQKKDIDNITKEQVYFLHTPDDCFVKTEEIEELISGKENMDLIGPDQYNKCFVGTVQTKIKDEAHMAFVCYNLNRLRSVIQVCIEKPHLPETTLQDAKVTSHNQLSEHDEGYHSL